MAEELSFQEQKPQDLFPKVTGYVARVQDSDIDTETIIPKRFVKSVSPKGLGRYVFYDLRYGKGDAPKTEFILNQPPFNMSSILIGGRNFGTGSSKEFAVWALQDFGFKAVIAPSFSEAFFENCNDNGLLALALSQEQIDCLFAYKTLSIDLKEQEITADDDFIINFDIDTFRRERLLGGVDAISQTMTRERDIASFEEKQKRAAPWLWPETK